MSEEFPEAPVIWTPTPETVAGAEMTRFITWLREARGLDFADYPALWDWSTTDITGFWTAIRDAAMQMSPDDTDAQQRRKEAEERLEQLSSLTRREPTPTEDAAEFCQATADVQLSYAGRCGALVNLGHIN